MTAPSKEAKFNIANKPIAFKGDAVKVSEWILSWLNSRAGKVDQKVYLESKLNSLNNNISSYQRAMKAEVLKKKGNMDNILAWQDEIVKCDSQKKKIYKELAKLPRTSVNSNAKLAQTTYEALEKNVKIVSLKVEDSILQVLTAKIINGKDDFGAYKINIRPNNYSPVFRNMTFKYKSENDNAVYGHPHFHSDGTACMGWWGTPMLKSWQAGDLVTYVNLAIALLELSPCTESVIVPREIFVEQKVKV